MRLQAIHCSKNLIKVSCSSSCVVCLLESLDGDIREEIADLQNVLTELIINQSAVCKALEI